MMTLKVMGIRMRAAIAAMAVTLAVSAQSRITDDGKEIYILTAARLKGSEASFSPKVYRYRDGAYELLTELPEATLKFGFSFGFQVAGDGSRFSVAGWFNTPEGEAHQSRIFSRDGALIAALTNSVVSEGGRFACQSFGLSPISYECGPVDGEGSRFAIPSAFGSIADLTDNGYVLRFEVGDVYTVWHNGARQSVTFKNRPLAPVLSRNGSSVLAVYVDPLLLVLTKNVFTGEERTIASRSGGFPRFSRNRKWIVEEPFTLARVDGSENFVSSTPVSPDLDADATATLYQGNLLFHPRRSDIGPTELVDVPVIYFSTFDSLVPGLVTNAFTITSLQAEKVRAIELAIGDAVVPVRDAHDSSAYSVTLNLQLPYDEPSLAASLHVQYRDSAFESQQPLMLERSAPKFLLQTCPEGCTAPNFFDRYPHPYPMILHEDLGSTVVPARPAIPGEVVYALLTGLGAVTNPPAAGVPVPADTASELINTVSCQARFGENKQDLLIRSAGLALGKIGVYQVSFVVPAIEWKGGISLDCRQDSSQSVASGMFLIQQPQ
jgi:uncharacterized protein (TIGR03437 family)